MNVNLKIMHDGDKGGWRMENPAENPENRFKNPKVEHDDTIRWHAPRDHDVFIVMLGDSPFSLKGNPIVNEIVRIPAGAKSEEYTVSANGTGGKTLEYGAMVATGAGDYTYVRGEMSPPGIIVKP